MDTRYGAIRLVDPATGREFARVDHPEQDPARWLCFSGDGVHLASVIWSQQSTHVWDLRAIRAELARLGLDWDLPAYPPAAAGDERPLRIELDKAALTPK